MLFYIIWGLWISDIQIIQATLYLICVLCIWSLLFNLHYDNGDWSTSVMSFLWYGLNLISVDYINCLDEGVVLK